MAHQLVPSSPPTFAAHLTCSITSSNRSQNGQRASRTCLRWLALVRSSAAPFIDKLTSHEGAATALGHELNCLTAMADSIPWVNSLKDSRPWEAISIHGLSHVRKQDEVWEEGRKGVQAGLAAVRLHPLSLVHAGAHAYADDNARLTAFTPDYSTVNQYATLCTRSTANRKCFEATGSGQRNRSAMPRVTGRLLKRDILQWGGAAVH